MCDKEREKERMVLLLCTSLVKIQALPFTQHGKYIVSAFLALLFNIVKLAGRERERERKKERNRERVCVSL